MLGYIVADKPELRMKEYQAYRSYYCGICKRTGERSGALPRFALSYDFAFLALLLSSLEEEEEKVEMQHCMIHPIKKIPITRDNRWIDYASDMMVLLVYYNFLDDKKDEHRMRGTAGALILSGNAKKISEKYPDVAEKIRESLENLDALEKEKSDSTDRTGDAFAQIMSAVFASEYVKERFGEADARILSHLGANVGRWIYLADAADDIAGDIASGSYNPLIYRYGFEKGKETPDEFKTRIGEEVKENMLCCLAESVKALELLPLRRNVGILKNIVCGGMVKKTEELLSEGEKKNEGSI